MGAGNPLILDTNGEQVNDTYFIDLSKFFNVELENLEDYDYNEFINYLEDWLIELDISFTKSDKIINNISAGFREAGIVLFELDNHYICTTTDSEYHNLSFGIVPKLDKEELEEEIREILKNNLEDIDIDDIDTFNIDCLLSDYYNHRVEEGNIILYQLFNLLLQHLDNDKDKFNKVVHIRGGAWISSPINDELYNKISNNEYN